MLFQPKENTFQVNLNNIKNIFHKQKISYQQPLLVQTGHMTPKKTQLP